LRALPSETVSLIDILFPWAGANAAAPRMILNPEVYPKLMTVAKMASHIPEELLRFQGSELAQYVFSVSAIETALSVYRERMALPARDTMGIGHVELAGLEYFANQSPIRLLRFLLARAPDVVPALGTSNFPFFSDEQLRAALHQELSDVAQSMADREWKAATVLGGATLEAVLFWSIKGMGTELAALPDKPKEPIDNWELRRLIDVARKLGLIEESTKKLAHLARDSRNLVHPSAVLSERRDCDKASSHTVVGAIEAVIRDISEFCQKRDRKL